MPYNPYPYYPNVPIHSNVYPNSNYPRSDAATGETKKERQTSVRISMTRGKSYTRNSAENPQ